jgi:hypothetical protein
LSGSAVILKPVPPIVPGCTIDTRGLFGKW